MSQFNQATERFDLLVQDATGEYRAATGDEVLKAARQVLGRRIRRGTALTSPQLMRDFLQTKLGDLEHKVFVTLLLDSQYRLIEYAEPFAARCRRPACIPAKSSRSDCSGNAAAMIFAHNHPSGAPEPSRADVTRHTIIGNRLQRSAPKNSKGGEPKRRARGVNVRFM